MARLNRFNAADCLSIIFASSRAKHQTGSFGSLLLRLVPVEIGIAPSTNAVVGLSFVSLSRAAKRAKSAVASIMFFEGSFENCRAGLAVLGNRFQGGAYKSVAPLFSQVLTPHLSHQVAHGSRLAHSVDQDVLILLKR